MGFAIIRQEKIKGAKSFNGRVQHNDRTFFSPNIVRENTHKNITLQKSKYENYDDFVAQKKEELRLSNVKNGTKNRFPRRVKNEDASLSQEFVISSSNEALTEQENIEYLKEANQFLKDWFKGCEVIQSEIHLDETTPHLHFVVSYFSEDRKKFIQKELSQNGSTDINQIREAFQKKVGDKYGLKKQDGTIVKPDKHTAKASLEVAKLKKKLSEALQDTKQLQDELDHAKSVSRDLKAKNESYREKFAEAGRALYEETLKVEYLENENESLRAQVSELQKGGELKIEIPETYEVNESGIEEYLEMQKIDITPVPKG